MLKSSSPTLNHIFTYFSKYGIYCKFFKIQFISEHVGKYTTSILVKTENTESSQIKMEKMNLGKIKRISALQVANRTGALST